MASLGALRSFGIVGGVAAFSIPSILGDMKKAEQEHKSKLWAGAKSAIAYNWQPIMLLGLSGTRQFASFGYMGLLLGAGQITKAGIDIVNNRNSWIRSAATPFSHSFDASDWAAEAQQRGMQTITGVRSIIGSEAASLNARYGRR